MIYAPIAETLHRPRKDNATALSEAVRPLVEAARAYRKLVEEKDPDSIMAYETLRRELERWKEL